MQSEKRVSFYLTPEIMDWLAKRAAMRRTNRSMEVRNIIYKAMEGDGGHHPQAKPGE